MWKLNGKKNKRNVRALEKSALAAYTPAYELIAPKRPAAALVLSSPHSGRLYPDSFLQQTKLPLHQLRLGEDCYVDQLIRPLKRLGIPILSALFPRCYVDVNRRADELPSISARGALPNHSYDYKESVKTRTGLGVIPTRIAQDLNIYNSPLSSKQMQARLDALYHPYHAALGGALQTAKNHFGHGLLLDCHSMPGKHIGGAARADFILGDRYGESCDDQIINALQSKLQSFGYKVTRNIPYAGGFITSHYGRPSQGIQAVQIEINKDLYLNPHTLEKHAGFGILLHNFEKTIVYMADTLSFSGSLAAQ